ncbi:hypothetical protein Ancab_020784 [Ancistrocladus abbreviatus]
MRGTGLSFENPIQDAISRLRFAPRSNNLLISSWDSVLRLYDVDDCKLRLEAGNEAALLDCCFQDESVAYSAGSDGSVCRYDLQSGTHYTIGNHDDSATCIEYSDETCQLFTTGWDRKIMHWDSRASKVLECFTCLSSNVDSISLGGVDLCIATGTSVNVYDLRNLDKAAHAVYTGIRTRCVRSIPHTKGFAVGSVDGRVRVWLPHPSSSEDMGYTFRCHPKSGNGKYHLAAVNDIAFNPQIPGAFITGDYEGYVIAWDSTARKRLFELGRYPNSVASLSYNQEGELLAVASSFTCQEASEDFTESEFVSFNSEDLPPEIFMQELGENYIKSASAGSSFRVSDA